MDPASQIFYFIILLFLLMLSAFFSAAETVYSTVSIHKLKRKADKNEKNAEKALLVAENFEETIGAILIGNNIANILETSIATTIFTINFGINGLFYSTIIMTITILIFGELLPKTIAKKCSLKLSMKFVFLITIFIKIFKPITKFFKLITKIFIKKEEIEPTVTEEELSYIVDKIADEGIIEKAERNLIKSAIEFDDKSIKNIYIKKENMFSIDLNETENLFEKMVSKQYSRVPVYINNIDNVIGILNEKEYLVKHIKKNGKVDIKKSIMNPIFVKENTRIDKAFKRMQKEKLHMAIVKDNNNKTLGLITMENLLESLVGEISDEFH